MDMTPLEKELETALLDIRRTCMHPFYQLSRDTPQVDEGRSLFQPPGEKSLMLLGAALMGIALVCNVIVVLF